MSRVQEPITSLPGIGTLRRVLVLGGVLVAYSLSACGTDDGAPTRAADPASGSAAVSTTVPGAPTPTTSPPATTPTAAATATTATTPPPGAGRATTPGQEGTGEVPGGDERGNRVPASFTVSAGTVTPSTVSVPAFLGIELRLRSGDGAAHEATLGTPDPVRVRVPASGTVSRRVGGLREGRYDVAVDGASGRATLIVADTAVGP